MEETERGGYGTAHAGPAGNSLEAWGRPDTVREAAALHHWPNRGGALTDAVQIGCTVAEHIGFGACGCHRMLASEDFPAPLAEVMGNTPLLDVFATEVNGVECSLM